MMVPRALPSLRFPASGLLRLMLKDSLFSKRKSPMIGTLISRDVLPGLNTKVPDVAR